MDNNFSYLLLNDRGLRAGPQGLELDIRLPWYRSLPLSVVEVVSLSIDGEPVAPERIRFEVNDKSFRLAELPDQIEEFWFVLDRAVLRVPGVEAAAGSSHRVEMQLNLYPPYIPHLIWVTRAGKDLRAGQAERAAT